MESQHVPRLPGHLPPRGAAAQLHRAPGGNGQQFGHPRVAAAAPRGVPRAHASSPGGCGARPVQVEVRDPSWMAGGTVLPLVSFSLTEAHPQ